MNIYDDISNLPSSQFSRNVACHSNFNPIHSVEKLVSYLKFR